MDNTFLTAAGHAMMDCLGLMAIPMLLLGVYLLHQESKKIPPGRFVASDKNDALEYSKKMQDESTERYLRTGEW